MVLIASRIPSSVIISRNICFTGQILLPHVPISFLKMSFKYLIYKKKYHSLRTAATNSETCLRILAGCFWSEETFRKCCAGRIGHSAGSLCKMIPRGYSLCQTTPLCPLPPSTSKGLVNATTWQQWTDQLVCAWAGVHQNQKWFLSHWPCYRSLTEMRLC